MYHNYVKIPNLSLYNIETSREQDKFEEGWGQNCTCQSKAKRSKSYCLQMMRFLTHLFDQILPV
jgi:hypothetical protein